MGLTQMLEPGPQLPCYATYSDCRMISETVSVISVSINKLYSSSKVVLKRPHCLSK